MYTKPGIVRFQRSALQAIAADLEIPVGGDEVVRIDLMEGESLSDFMGQLYRAVYSMDSRMDADFHVWAVFDGHVVAEDWYTGKFYRFDYTREGDEIVLTNVQEGRLVFEPTGESMAVTRSEQDEPIGRSAAADENAEPMVRMILPEVEQPVTWGNVLPFGTDPSDS